MKISSLRMGDVSKNFYIPTILSLGTPRALTNRAWYLYRHMEKFPQGGYQAECCYCPKSIDCPIVGFGKVV